MSKITEIYLATISSVYVLLGICVLIPNEALAPFAVMIGIAGSVLGFIPNASVFLDSGLANKPVAVTTGFDPLISLLAALAIAIGIMAVISLFRIEKNKDWIWLWYSLLALTILIFLSNLTTFGFLSLSFVHPILFSFAIFDLVRLHTARTREEV